MSNAQASPVVENVAPAVESKPQETPGFKVFAGNLAYTTTDEGLKAFFAPVQSQILSVQVIMRGTRSAGYGFVALSTEEAANKAAETLNKLELDGRQVIVEIAKPAEEKDQEKRERKAKRRPGRRGSKAVPGEVTEAEANGEAPKLEVASGAEDEAKPKSKKRKSPRKKRTTAAEGEAPAATEEAVQAAEGAEAAKKPPRIRKPRTPRPVRPAGEDPAGEPSKTMLFVANLGFTVDDAALGALFTEAGIDIVSARIVRRRWGQPRKSKGYGFVDVGSEANQQKAIAALEGKEVAGRPIAVKIAVNTPQEDEKNEENPSGGAAADESTPAPAPAAATPAPQATPGADKEVAPAAAVAT